MYMKMLSLPSQNSVEGGGEEARQPYVVAAIGKR